MSHFKYLTDFDCLQIEKAFSFLNSDLTSIKAAKWLIISENEFWAVLQFFGGLIPCLRVGKRSKRRCNSVKPKNHSKNLLWFEVEYSGREKGGNIKCAQLRYRVYSFLAAYRQEIFWFMINTLPVNNITQANSIRFLLSSLLYLIVSSFFSYRVYEILFIIDYYLMISRYCKIWVRNIWKTFTILSYFQKINKMEWSELLKGLKFELKIACFTLKYRNFNQITFLKLLLVDNKLMPTVR